METLLDKPTDASVEIAVSFGREVGALIENNHSVAAKNVYSLFRGILQSKKGISDRVQYMVEVYFQQLKDKFKDNPTLPEGLDLVEEDDQIPHEIELSQELKVEESLSKSPV